MRRPGIVEHYRLVPVRDMNTLVIEAACMGEGHIDQNDMHNNYDNVGYVRVKPINTDMSYRRFI